MARPEARHHSESNPASYKQDRFKIEFSPFRRRRLIPTGLAGSSRLGNLAKAFVSAARLAAVPVVESAAV
jgi:hypothetical protein